MKILSLITVLTELSGTRFVNMPIFSEQLSLLSFQLQLTRLRSSCCVQEFYYYLVHYKTPFCRGQNLKRFTEVIPSCTLSHVPYKVPTSFDLIKGKTFYLTAEAKILDYLEYISNKTIPSHLKNIMLKLILYSIVSFGLANN